MKTGAQDYAWYGAQNDVLKYSLIYLALLGLSGPGTLYITHDLIANTWAL